MLERSGETDFPYTLHAGSSPATIQWYFHDRTRLPVAVQSWTLPPGGSEGPHTHGEDEPLEELYIVTAGTATMRLDGTEHQLGPGDALLAPPGTEHDVRNTGAVPLSLLVVWGRPGEADFSPFGTYRAAAAARTARETQHGDG